MISGNVKCVTSMDLPIAKNLMSCRLVILRRRRKLWLGLEVDRDLGRDLVNQVKRQANQEVVQEGRDQG